MAKSQKASGRRRNFLGPFEDRVLQLCERRGFKRGLESRNVGFPSFEQVGTGPFFQPAFHRRIACRTSMQAGHFGGLKNRGFFSALHDLVRPGNDHQWSHRNRSQRFRRDSCLDQRIQSRGFADPGYNKAHDITACPGTDTCNLGIASSTGIAAELERVIKIEFPEYINNPDLVIKISGCMNACGQHTIANIGFQGMSIRTNDKRVAPALQVLLGGGNLGNGKGKFADKVIKIPSKRGPEALRRILLDFRQNGKGIFQHYYAENGEKYFYELLKPLANIDHIEPEELIDWGSTERYKKAIGIGECAGVVIDLVATLFFESDEKIALAKENIQYGKWTASIYYSYSSLVNSAKALLTSENTRTNTHASIIKDFQELFVENKRLALGRSFEELVLQINRNEPSENFARIYLKEAEDFLKMAEACRAKELQLD